MGLAFQSAQTVDRTFQSSAITCTDQGFQKFIFGAGSLDERKKGKKKGKIML
jgi:hypothetical protein